MVWSVLWVCTIYDTPALHPGLHPSEADLFTREGANVGRGSQRVVRLTVIVRGGSRNFKTGVRAPGAPVLDPPLIVIECVLYGHFGDLQI